MMKNFLVLVILLCVAGGAAYYFNPQAKKFIDGLLQDKYKIKDAITKSANPETTFYKWHNDLGVLQLTQNPPAEGIPYETVTVSNDANVIPGIETDGVFD